MVNWPKHCQKLNDSTFTISIDPCEGKSVRFNSLLIICKILGHFLNPLTGDEKYCILSSDSLLQHIEMHLSHKRKRFSEIFFFFLHFLNFDSILNIFKKKMTLISDVFLNLLIPKYVVGLLSKKSGFRGPFEK